MLNKILLPIVLMLLVSSSSVAGEKKAKGNVHPNLKLSLTERFRLVTWDNAISLDDSADAGQAFTRHRTSLKAEWFPTETFEACAMLTNEFRHYFAPTTKDFTFDEIFFDQLYLRWRNERLLPGTLTVGRQNMIFGEGFVVLDGSPLDGSRHISFNAARYDWQINAANKLTLFYLYQDDVDDALPIIHDQEKELVEWPEEGFGAYFSTEIEASKAEAYLIRKNVKPTHDFPESTYISIGGIRVVTPLSKRLQGTAEAAYQLGKYDLNDRSAFGGYGYLTYKTDWANYLPRSIQVGAVYLAGDDPDTPEDNEGWEPMFGRWPKWSESYIYTEINEGGVAYWTNFVSLFGRTTFEVAHDVSLRLEYHRLRSVERSEVALNLRGTGMTRGNLVIGKLEYKASPYLSGHVLWESFRPGDFYNCDADGYHWVRIELMFTVI